jgi:fucose permease
MQAVSSERFVRTRFTLLAYFMLAYYAYLMAILGPLMPFLADELRLSYTEQGLHFTAFALGVVFAGLFADRITVAIGRRQVFWLGGVGMAVGSLLLTTAESGLMSVVAALMMGGLGALLLVTIQASLSDAHGEQRAFALTESNIAASLAASAAPLLVGEFQRDQLGWRLAVFLVVGFYLLVLARFWTMPIVNSLPEKPTSDNSPARLPRLFWVYWTVIFLSVASEWSIAYWGAGFLEGAIQMPKADASSAMTFFFGAVLVGRIVGSRLTRVVNPRLLLCGAMALPLLGFPLFWLGQHVALNLFGLVLVGLGIANQFPLTITLALGTASKLVNRASARASLATGIAILIVPQVLGFIADITTIRAAYSLVFILMILAAIGSVLATRQSRLVKST